MQSTCDRQMYFALDILARMTTRNSALDASSFWALAPPHLVFPDVCQEKCLICSHDDKY